MALSLSATIKNQIAYQLWSQAYASVNATQQAQIDTFGADALAKIQQYSQFAEQVSTSSAPDAWSHWLVAETVASIGHNAHPERVPNYERERRGAMVAAMESFNRKAVTYDPSSDTEAFLLNVQNTRHYVLVHCVKRKPSLLPSIEAIDSALDGSLQELWSKAGWVFRRRQCVFRIRRFAFTGATWTEASRTLTATGAFTDYTAHVDGARVLIDTGSGAEFGQYVAATRVSNDAITLQSSISQDAENLTGVAGALVYVKLLEPHRDEVFDAIASRSLWYTDESGRGASIEWADDDEMAALRAESEATSDRPEYFRIEGFTGVTPAWIFHPFPDAEYSFRGAVMVRRPANPTSATETTTFGKFITEVRDLVRDMTLARVLKAHDAPRAYRFGQDVDERVERMMPIYDDIGRADDERTIRDVYRDIPGNQLGGAM